MELENYKENPSHPSLNFKKLEGYNYWSARVTRGYRAVAFEDEEGFVWFSIRKHDAVYESLREEKRGLYQSNSPCCHN